MVNHPSRRHSRASRTARDLRRRTLGQNFLVDERAIDSAVGRLGAPAGSLVLDLGAGGGALTEPAARSGLRVLAVECDPDWAKRLRASAPKWGDVTVMEQDLTRMPFPAEPYYVVSNPPYDRGTEVVRRLLSDAHGLTRAVVVLQLQTARRLAGRPRGGRLPATWAPWFELTVHERIPASAFRPIPRVDSAILTLTPRARPLLSPAAFADYKKLLSEVFEGRGTTIAERLRRRGSRAQIQAALKTAGIATDATPSQPAPERYAAVFAATQKAQPATSHGRRRHPPR